MSGSVNRVFFGLGFEVREQRIFASVRLVVLTERGAFPRAAGHSLGGALASLAAYDIAVELGLSHVECVTFGAPRVGNRPFVAHYNRLVKDTWCPVPAKHPARDFRPGRSTALASPHCESCAGHNQLHGQWSPRCFGLAPLRPTIHICP